VKQLYIGIMSGTSLDGVDIAIVDFSNDKLSLFSSYYKPYPAVLLADITAACGQTHISYEALGTLDAQLGKFYAQCVQDTLHNTSLSPHDIVAIGSHGQTIHHSPNSTPPFTLQIGDANRIAEETGITVVADFRRRDIAAGGQGAPLVPTFHQAIFQSAHDNQAIINIGGISNVSYLNKDQTNIISGFDCGPGNTLMNQWCQQHFERPYDHCGQLSKTGRINTPLLNSMMDDPYFARPYPKSTGPEYFNLNWLASHIERHPGSTIDTLTSLCELTAQCIAKSLTQLPGVDNVLVCGGGVHNDYLMTRLRHLIELPIDSTEAHGLHPDWVEASAFAWLAKRALEGKTGNLPSVTGADKAVILGSIYPA
jgi:anhydro-N-acetylmuramic acid kinase